MSRNVDLGLYLVLDAATTPPTSFPALAEAAVQGGAMIVQVRDKTASAQALIRTVRAVRARLAGSPVPVIVNDRVDVAVAAGADGAHVGQDDLPPAAARAILGKDRILGLSVTSEAEIETVDPAVVDHVGLGPLFATATKPDAAPPLGVERFQAIRSRLKLPVVAIGGIGMDSAESAVFAGADGVAVVSAIARSSDPRAAARALSTLVARARQARGRY
ncbi:thiamine phosphate synthase [Geminicoccus roseus]|uniref:thiamine phosphate synthase n=1 Tax=Geminicoccus roseus TaxID=404900 RepID=UPI00040455B3|nr:thiamine phosphate synthase [Geminicoccus roseus]